jgi:hypothetical protein
MDINTVNANTITLQFSDCNKSTIYLIPKDMDGIIISYNDLTFNCTDINVYKTIIKFILDKIGKCDCMEVIRNCTIIYTITYSTIVFDWQRHIIEELSTLFYICKIPKLTDESPIYF